MFSYMISSIFTKSYVKVTILWMMQQKLWEVRQITNVGATGKWQSQYLNPCLSIASLALPL